MKVLTVVVGVMVALAALMGSTLAMPEANALADPDPAAEPQFGFGGGRFGSGEFRGRGRFGGDGFRRHGSGGRRFGSREFRGFGK
nr:uncharacterized protein LOC123770751 isoform X3 [Procambarus clarkii]